MCLKSCRVFTYGAGITLSLAGLAIAISWSAIFNNIWKVNLELNPSSKSYRLWLKTPMPLYMELYLFNWTNSEAFIRDKTLKPSFDEVGPFVFKEVHERVGVMWNDNNTVTYKQKRTWHFVPEESVNMSVPITNLNVVLLAITKAASSRGILIKELLEFLSTIYKEELIITRPAREWLFDGMNDSLLNFIRKRDASLVPFDKFGWFYGRNQSSTFDGVFNIKTGVDDIYNLGLLNEWNNCNRTEYFNDDCGIVKGSTTELFPPLHKLESNLSIFISDFCGPVTLINSGSKFLYGMEGYHFVGDASVFDNGTIYKNVKCFCTGECSPSGVRNETLCRGAPVFISFPHFYLADPYYVNSVEGIKPNKSNHEFYLTINPLSGLPLDVRAQLQVNVLLQPLSAFHMFSKVPKIYIPMMWFRQRIELSETLSSLGIMLQIIRELGKGLGFGLIIIGILIISIRVFRDYLKYNGSKKLLLASPEQGTGDLMNHSDEE